MEPETLVVVLTSELIRRGDRCQPGRHGRARLKRARRELRRMPQAQLVILGGTQVGAHTMPEWYWQYLSEHWQAIRNGVWHKSPTLIGGACCTILDLELLVKHFQVQPRRIVLVSRRWHAKRAALMLTALGWPGARIAESGELTTPDEFVMDGLLYLYTLTDPLWQGPAGKRLIQWQEYRFRQMVNKLGYTAAP